MAAYLVVVALLLGSFINLALDRVPRGESVVRPPSRCRACGRRLNAIDLIPVAGYLVRKGRCATCGTPIGITSPILEAASGVLMLAAILIGGVWPGAASGQALVAGWGVLVVTLGGRRAGSG